ncbi:Ig-like domain-containing protein [Arthrobacter monumenti]
MISTSTIAAVAITGAVLYPGFKTADVDLNDGGVWVTNTSQNLVGHLNYQSKVLDGGFLANSAGFDVLQDAGTVFMENTDHSTLNSVDVAKVGLGSEQQIPSGAEISLGSNTMSIASPATGEVWITTAGSLGSFSPENTKPVLTASPEAAATVAEEDTVFIADPAAGQIVQVDVDQQGAVTNRETTEADALERMGETQIAAVGDEPVIFDGTTGLLRLPGGNTVQLPDAERARLQQSGPESGFVAIATRDGLIKQPLDGSEASVVPLESQGVPAQPVQLGGCVHAAWAGAGLYLRDCGGTEDDKTTVIPQVGANAGLEFRVNRDVVVLNDLISGNIWLVNKNMQLVNNWDDIIPPPDESDEEEEDSADDNPIDTLPDRTKENREPVAEDDSYGVRPGRTTLLPVLDNDSDPDGDLLTASLVGDGPDVGSLQRIYDGTGLQVVVPKDASSGTHSFTYEADDGRGGTDQATVQLVVRGPESNEPPKSKRETKILLEQGGSISQNVLSDWIDPDGDDLFLTGAKATSEGDQVRFRADGRLTFQDVGTSYGEKDVQITVSDGRASTEGTVTMDVRPPGALPPVANPDHVSTSVGQEVLISPLKNDLDPNGGTLRLARVDPERNIEFTPDYEAGTVTVESGTPGTYYLKYLVTNDPASSTGLIRIDVKAGGEEGAPVAVRDVALLPSNGDVLVDVLGNDTDPNGGVLVVQSVSVPVESPLNVAVLDHSILRITDSQGLSGQTSIRYTMSNGTASATGEVSVIPVPAPATLQPPEATADEATVRAGDVVTIDVLDNDSHPNGDELSLDPKLVQDIEGDDGRLFVSQDKLRFIAGPKAKTVHAIYNVADTSGQKDSAQVTINIRANDPKHNSRPEPESLTGRVLAGSSIRIPVPLNGIDADGDSVLLTGVGDAPEKGTALVGSNYIDYVAAGNASGTDSFTYTVRDRQGATNTGTVLVGIAPKLDRNQKPVAIDDAVHLRPGKRVAVNSLKNDSDPDGDAIGFVKAGLDAKDALEAKVREDRILVSAPESEGIQTVRYGIADERGAEASAVVRLDVDKDAPLHLPVARDDRVTVAETLGKTAVSVAVLDNDEDPDGVAEDLKIGFPGSTANASVSVGGEALIELTRAPQVIPYTVTDVDGGKATAIIWVPGVGDQIPTLADKTPIEVQAGESFELDLADAVQVRDGRSARITEVESVRGIGNSNTEMVVDEDTLTYTAAPDYAGPGSITFEVTDGSGPDDPDGNKATLTVMTEVIPDPDRNTPPEFSSSSLQVAEAEEGQSLDLAKLVEDPDRRDQGEHEFAIDGEVPAGYDASLDGSILTVKANDAADPGYTGDVNLSVTDGRSDPVTASVTVTTTASNRALAIANDDVVTNAFQGETETVDVLSNDVSPYDDAPLKVVEAVVETGQGSASVDGGTVAVTPSDDFVGTMVVRYTVADKTGDPNRYVDARVRLTVKGAPDTPGTPIVEEVRNQTVVLSWNPPSNNGSPIANYTVTGNNGVQQDCGATTCTIDGLTNDVVYQFKVTATNAVGTSDPSPQSAEARPDAKPERPQPPKLTFGDGSVDVSWDTPPTPGSPVESFNLRISPAPPGGGSSKTGVTGNSLTWDGLENGVAYKVQVQAVNDAPDPSDWSAYSAAEIPAGKPAVPQAPSTQRVKPVGNQSQLQVDWNAPAGNGDPVESYTLQILRGGSVQRSLEVAGTSQAVTVPNAEADYTFRVSATNKAGTSDLSAPSAPRRAFGQPGTVSNLSATPANTGGAGQAITVRFNELSPSQRNGAKAGEINYRASFSDGRSMGISNGQTVGGFDNGTRHSVQITAVSTSDGASYNGSASAAASTVPYGSPGTPSVSARSGSQGQKNVSFSWSPPNTSTHDVARMQINFGNGWQSVPVGNGSKTVNTNGYNESKTMSVRTANSKGNWGPTVSATGRSGSEPPPPVFKTGVNNEVRTCMERYGVWGYYYSGEPKRCEEPNGTEHWAYPANGPRNQPASSITARCYYMVNDIPWYLQESGSPSRNNGHIIKGIHTRWGTNPPAGMPSC